MGVRCHLPQVWLVGEELGLQNLLSCPVDFLQLEHTGESVFGVNHLADPVRVARDYADDFELVSSRFDEVQRVILFHPIKELVVRDQGLISRNIG